MDTQWWVSCYGDQKGPLSTPQLKQWIKEGRVTPDCFARIGCDGEWILVKRLRFSTDWNGVFKGIAVAVVLILGFEAALVLMARPGAVFLSGSLLAVYLFLMARVYGLPKVFRKKKKA